ncbi:MAG: hypothetical protein WCE68_00440 [Anaerolineales bacterium]
MRKMSYSEEVFWTVLPMLAAIALLLALPGCMDPSVTPTVTALPTVPPTPTVTETSVPVATVPPIATIQATPANTPAPATVTPCPIDTAKVQTVLQSTIPKQFWGLHYQTNGAHPPTMLLYGVTSGQTDSRTIQGITIDLARMYYLHADGTLDNLWVALGFSEGSDPYTSFNNVERFGWQSSQEAQEIFSKSGQVFSVGIADWYVHPDGIRWDQCATQAQYTSAAVCALGLAIDKGSVGFFDRGTPSEGWFAFGWFPAPNRENAYRFPFPDTATLPEATCAGE